MSEVHAAVIAVMKDVGAIGRDGEMQQGERYKYRRQDDVLARVQPALIKHGLLISPASTRLHIGTKTSHKGNPLAHVTIEVEWLVMGFDGSQFTGASAGEAIDSSDKATNKASTAAHKNFLCELLHIPYSQQDPDDDRVELGRRVDPDADAIAAGFESEKDRVAEHKRVALLIGSVPKDQREPFQVFKAEHGWPMSADRLVELSSMVQSQVDAREAPFDEVAS